MIMLNHGFLRLFGQFVLLGAMLASPLFLFAQNGAPPETPSAPTSGPTETKPWWNFTTDGYLSFSYNYNTNAPQSHLNQFRVFDFNQDAPQLDVAQLVFQHAVTAPRQFGFRVNLLAGSGVPEITAAYGLFRDTHTGIAHHFDIPEVYLSYIVPVGKGLRLDGGKFATYLGYEVIGGYDGYNDNFSRSFLFGYGVPFTQTGVKASYSLNTRISATVSLTNGCDAVRDLNAKLTVGAQVALATSKNTNLTLSFLHGPERPNNGHDQRSIYEVTGAWKLTPRFTLGSDALYGHEDHAAVDGADATWKGVAGYSKYGFTKQFSLAFRAEVFADIGGSRTGIPQTLWEFTLTPEYDLRARFSRLNDHFKPIDGRFVVRGEFRRDSSNRNSFCRYTGFTSHQFTTAANLIYFF